MVQGNDFLFEIWTIPVSMTPKERISLKIKSNQYVLITEILFRRNYDGMLLRCVDATKVEELIK